MSDVQLGVGSVAAWSATSDRLKTGFVGVGIRAPLNPQRPVNPAYASHVPSEERRAVTADVAGTSEAVPVCAEILSQGRELPLSKDQTHWLLKSAFLGCYETPLGLVPKESHTLDTHSFFEFTSAVEAHFRSEFGAVFPDWEDQFEH